MKKKLREGFSIEQNGEVIIGPCEVDLTDKEIKENEHKLEEIVEETKKQKKGN